MVSFSGVLVAFRAPSRTKTPSKLCDGPFFALRTPASGYRHATFCPKFCVTDYLQIVMLNEVKHLYADSSLMNAQNGRALRMAGCRSVIDEVAEAYAKE